MRFVKLRASRSLLICGIGVDLWPVCRLSPGGGVTVENVLFLAVFCEGRTRGRLLIRGISVNLWPACRSFAAGAGAFNSPFHPFIHCRNHPIWSFDVVETSFVGPQNREPPFFFAASMPTV